MSESPIVSGDAAQVTTRRRNCARFSRDYELLGSIPMRHLERTVLGCDYGATSWTTRHEAARIADLLELDARMRLLDVGAGAGWPSLYVAQLTGCEVALTDLPLVGLEIARERAARDGLIQRCTVLVADGAALPFADASFDAVSHSDVLCCMPTKLEMLQECRRIARSGSRMVFSVIAPALSLSEAERRRAIASGPEFVDVPEGYQALLEQSGWRLRSCIDVTDEFLHSMQVSVECMRSESKSLIDVLGKNEFSERVARRQTTIAAVASGILKRELVVAA